MSEQEEQEPRQLTVAELLARHGRTLPDSSSTGPRRAADDDAGEGSGQPSTEDVSYAETGPLDEQTAEHEIEPVGVSGSRVRRIRAAARRRRNARDDRREGPDERSHRTAYQRHPALRALVVLGVIMVLLACYYTAVLFIARGTIERVDVLHATSNDIIDAAAQEGSTTSLIVVADTSGYRDHGAQITALAHQSADGSTLTIVSFPRTLLIDMPPCGTSENPVGPTVTTVETVFAIGGPQCSVSAIQAATGIGIDHYIGFDLAQFPDMIDALSGITVCLRAPLADPALGLDLPAGDSTLDGETATNYVRAVNGGTGDDPGRADRQVDFLGRLFQKVVSIKTLANPVAITRFAFASADALTLDSDTSLGDLRKLGAALGGAADTTVRIVVPPLSPDVQQLPGTNIDVQRMEPVYARTMFDAIIAGEAVEQPAAPDDAPGEPAGGDESPPETSADEPQPSPSPAAQPMAANC